MWQYFLISVIEHIWALINGFKAKPKIVKYYLFGCFVSNCEIIKTLHLKKNYINQNSFLLSIINIFNKQKVTFIKENSIKNVIV